MGEVEELPNLQSTLASPCYPRTTHPAHELLAQPRAEGEIQGRYRGDIGEIYLLRTRPMSSLHSPAQKLTSSAVGPTMCTTRT